MLFATTGLPRVGKDTAVSILIDEYDFKRFAFGDEIYNEVSRAFDVPIAYLRSDDWKRNPTSDLALNNCRDKAFSDLITGMERSGPAGLSVARTSRFILQRWGTEYRRASNPTYWIDKVIAQLAFLPRGTKIAISDLREDPELDALEKYCAAAEIPFRVVEIVSARGDGTNHSSDAGITRSRIHNTIANDETINDLHLRVEAQMDILDMFANIDRYPEMVSRLFKQMGSESGSLAHAAMGFVGEIGEYQEASDNDDIVNVKEELGDAFFYLQVVMTHFGWTVEKFKNVAPPTTLKNPVHIFALACRAMDLIKKYWVYENVEKMAKFETAFADLVDSFVYECATWGHTLRSLKRDNQLKLSKRYASGVFSNEQAIARADKKDGE